MAPRTSPADDKLELAARLERARASGRTLIDLTETSLSRCGLASAPPGPAPTPDEARVASEEEQARATPAAREAVAGYLGEHGARVAPEQIFFVASIGDAYALAFRARCDPGDEVLVASPGTAHLPGLGDAGRIGLRHFAVHREPQGWRIDRRSLRKAMSERTRAVFLTHPSIPTGALVSASDLEFLDEICGERGLTLMGDEAFLDAARPPASSVAAVRQCLALHVSGAGTVCGTQDADLAWIAVAGRSDLVSDARSRIERMADDGNAAEALGSALRALPGSLQRRGAFHQALRARLDRNWSWVAGTAVGEAHWSIPGNRDGPLTVLELGMAVDEEALCLALLEEDGVVVAPGSWYGCERPGLVVVSLVVPPEPFMIGLRRLEERLRSARYL